jgi:uncharacterized delta-60 repeat protein
MKGSKLRKRRLAAIAGAGVTAAMLVAAALAHPQAGAHLAGTADHSGSESAASVDIAYALARARDGKLVAGGLSSNAGREVALARYALDGRLDRNFGTCGRVLADFGSPSTLARAIAIQADGKIVVAGGVGFVKGSGFVLVRFTARGRLDRSFGRNGKVFTRFDPPTSASVASAIAIQPDGKLVAVGASSDDPVSGPTHFALARYTRDGHLDPTFGRGGKVLSGLEPRRSDYANALAFQADSKLLVAGTSFGPGHEDCAVARFTARGEPDASFGAGGRALTAIGYSCVANSVLSQPDGMVVIAGSAAVDDSAGFALVRYTADGKLDPSFGAGGKVTTDFEAERSEIAHALALQSDGKLVAAGAINGIDKYDRTRFALARYTAAGALDPSFGPGGKVITDLGSSPRLEEHQATAWAVTMQPDGKIVAAGSSRGDFALVRYTSSGSLDPSFGSSGKVTTAFGSLWRTKLASLSATRISRDVVVRWRTASELDARGFNLYRDEGAGRRRANNALIRASRRRGDGAAYSFRDRRPPRSTRGYWLQEVTVGGTRRWLGHVVVRR